MGSVVRTSVFDKVLGLVTEEWEVLRVVVVKVADIWAKLVLTAGRAGLVKDSVKAGGKETPEWALTVTTLVDSVDRDSRLGDFASVMIFSCCGMLWFLGSAVLLLWSILMDDAIVDVWTEVLGISLALGRTRVDECGKAVCETESGVGEEAVKDTGKGDGEEDKGVDDSEVDFSWWVEALVDGKLDENNWWDCDTEGRGIRGSKAEDESPTDPVLASTRTKVFGILMVEV